MYFIWTYHWSWIVQYAKHIELKASYRTVQYVYCYTSIGSVFNTLVIKKGPTTRVFTCFNYRMLFFVDSLVRFKFAPLCLFSLLWWETGLLSPWRPHVVLTPDSTVGLCPLLSATLTFFVEQREELLLVCLIKLYLFSLGKKSKYFIKKPWSAYKSPRRGEAG